MTIGKTIITIAVLWVLAIPSFLIALYYSVLQLLKSKKRTSKSTVLLTGGKMTKCLQLARLFYSNGFKVVVVETPLYKYCGTRYSSSVSDFEIIPEIHSDGEDYQNELARVAQKYNADLFVPVSSPKSAYYSALARDKFQKKTMFFHLDAKTVKLLDHKHDFIELAKSIGLSVPESYTITSPQQLLNFEFTKEKSYVLKKLDYDPIHRLDLRTIPHQGWEDRVKNLEIREDSSWVLQEFIEGREVCVHTTSSKGKMTLYICCPSSPFQVNYQPIDVPEVRIWVTTFLQKLNATGQLSFDFIIRKNGEVIPIECNPRTHSAITLMHGQPETVDAYTNVSKINDPIVPNAKANSTYWLYHELYRIITAFSFSKIKKLMQRISSEKEAVFRKEDPWPFFFTNHISIPYQLWMLLFQGKEWLKIDFNIGKIVVSGGD
ncbi:hypothetical protein J8281_07515 [Aquimarina sp. U1-2]|nr:hypothetical protein [Aquimarina sp. U1-2]